MALKYEQKILKAQMRLKLLQKRRTAESGNKKQPTRPVFLPDGSYFCKCCQKTKKAEYFPTSNRMSLSSLYRKRCNDCIKIRKRASYLKRKDVYLADL